MFALAALEDLSQGSALELRDVARIGSDIRVIARVKS
jgi:hypothetical protein